MRESVAPYAVAATTRSTSPPIRKLAGHLLGCTCAAALWLNGSMDELWAYESYSQQAKQYEEWPQKAVPTAQQNRRQAHTKRREKTQEQVRESRHSGKQKPHTKTTGKRRPEINGATKASRSKSVQHASVRANSKAHAKSGYKTIEQRRPETKNATTAVRSKSRSMAAGRDLKVAHAKSRTKTARSCRLETKKPTKAERPGPVQCSHSRVAARDHLKAARAKSRTKTVAHRRQPAKSGTRSETQAKIAGHHRSAGDTRVDKSVSSATNRRSRIKTVRHRNQHEVAAKNTRVHTRSAAVGAAVPLSSPRPAPPAPRNRKAAIIPADPGLNIGVPGAASAQRAEEGSDTHSALRPTDQILQPIQPSDRAAILERDRLGMLELPKEIQDLMPKSPPPAQEVVNEARTYLIRTSTEQRERCVGDTMVRQGVEIAIGRLHPVMAVRIARSIEQARNEGIPACVYSAFRPPAFGVGGFSDKYNSAHAYGIAVDFGGIDRPGSKTARRFQEIAASNGLYSLYGPGDRAEWNHYQLIPVRRIAPNNPLRDTITASGPKDEIAMWTRSGVPLDKVEPVAFRAENAIISTRTKISHHHSHHRQHMAALKVAPLSPFGRVQHTTATKILPLSPFMRAM